MELQWICEEVSDMYKEATYLGASITEEQPELWKELHHIVSEIYSPPRVTHAARMLPRLGVTPGFALDITTTDENGVPWDFSRDDRKKKATQLVINDEPDLLVGSPMCKDYSPWQRLNKAKSQDPDKYVAARRQARTH